MSGGPGAKCATPAAATLMAPNRRIAHVVEGTP